MMRGRDSELMSLVLADLRRLGYTASYPERCSGFGKKVFWLSRSEEQFHALIQVRSYDPSTFRYLVGIVIPDLRRVDQVILWFEKEYKLVKIPASFLILLSRYRLRLFFRGGNMLRAR